MRGQILDHTGRPSGQKRRAWLPRDLGGNVCESWADQGVTLGTIPRSQGTSPPVLTFSGTLTGTAFPYVQIDSTAGGTALGQATYKVSYDDGATFPHTGIVTSGTPTALPSVGSAILASFAAGPFNTNNIYQPLVAQASDLSGQSTHGTEATAANRMIARAVAFNGRPAFDCGTAGTFGLTTPSVSLGAYSVFILLRGDAGSTWTFVHNAIANGVGSEIFDRSTFNVSLVPPAGVGSKSAKNITTTWLSDGVRRSVAVTFNGTHATHLAYRNAVLDTTADATAHDPGTATRSGALYFGYPPAKSSGHQGLIAGWVVGNRAWTAAEVARLHAYAIRRFPL